MTGPSLPRPVPGSNAIGSFQIGISPIGDIPSFDVWTTIISQYANSPTLTQMICNFARYIDQTKNLQNFFDLVWNVDTAEGYGLDIWGRIVGVIRTLEIGTTSYFGFQGPIGASGDPFNQSAFYRGQPITENYALTDKSFRTLILAKAFANITDGSIPSMNSLLMSIFPGRGKCYVTDGLDMTMTYTFEFQLSPVDAAIVGQSGVLPKPTGVLASVVQIYT